MIQLPASSKLAGSLIHHQHLPRHLKGSQDLKQDLFGLHQVIFVGRIVSRASTILNPGAIIQVNDKGLVVVI